MKLNIKTTIRDNFDELKHACKKVDFCGDWKFLTPDQRIYFYKLIRADINFAIKQEKEGFEV